MLKKTKMYAASGESNYRTAPTSSTGMMSEPPQIQKQPSSVVNGQISNNNNCNSNAQSSSHMSVAAKAGEMQIFSADILSQVNGLQRQRASKAVMLR